MQVERCKNLRLDHVWHKIWNTSSVFGLPAPNGWASRSRIDWTSSTGTVASHLIFTACPLRHALLQDKLVSLFIHSLISLRPWLESLSVVMVTRLVSKSELMSPNLTCLVASYWFDIGYNVKGLAQETFTATAAFQAVWRKACLIHTPFKQLWVPSTPGTCTM